MLGYMGVHSSIMAAPIQSLEIQLVDRDVSSPQELLKDNYEITILSSNLNKFVVLKYLD